MQVIRREAHAGLPSARQLVVGSSRPSSAPAVVRDQSPLDRLLASLPEDSLQRGKAFERLSKWFLENDALYRSKLRHVWLWKDWPGRWGPDAGIDLVAEAIDGALWAIQCKAYAPHVAITKGDVDTFLAESAREEFGFRLLVASTDRIGTTAKRTLEGQSIPVGTLMASDLNASEVSWPSSLSYLRPSPTKAKTPLPHQRRACVDVVKGLSLYDRGQLIMACGTGKTLTALFVAEALNARRVLFLVPSLSLLSQVVHSWVTSSRRPLEFAAVCSDESVVDEDQLLASTADLAFPATTDSGEVAQFLRSRRGGCKVVFATYQSSAVIAQAQESRLAPAFDLIVADEAHRLAGDLSSEFASVLHEERIRGRKRLFMTATPRYATGRVLRAAREADIEFASMDDPALFGPQLHKLSFGEAIQKELLTDYQVAVVAIDDMTYLDWARRGVFVRSEGLQSIDARSLATHLGLAKAFKKFDITRAISFHARIKAAREFADRHAEVLRWMSPRQRPSGAVATSHISGEMTAGERRLRLEWLRNPSAERALLTNARCLTEGIDVPSLDGVAFVDPRRSEVDIVQAVGRAIRRSPSKRIGTIVIPVFIGAQGNAESAIVDSAFKPVWDVLNALRSHDDELGQELDSLRRGLGSGRVREPALPPKIMLDLPSWVPKEFVRAIQAQVVERTTSSWEFMFGLLQTYVAREGHALVPRAHLESDHQLGGWVGNQRQLRERMSPVRRAQLEGLDGWVWDSVEDAWQNGYKHLVAYAKREGNGRVPVSHLEQGYRLGQWAAVQRRNRTQLSAERVRLLEQIPEWTWDPYAADWERAYRALLSFRRREGHAAVPRPHIEDGVRLGQWIGVQRADRGRMPLERRQKLEAVDGWSWNSRDDAWDRAFAALEIYVQREGNPRVPLEHVERGIRLGRWLKSQRRLGRKLRASRRKRLEALDGWSWELRRDDWEDAFQLLERYMKRKGDAQPPAGHIEDGFALGSWVKAQRRNRSSMTASRRRRLEALKGWSWDPFSDAWDSALMLLKAFSKREGHARVPLDHVEQGFRLGGWVGNQRTKRKTMPLDRVRRLEGVKGWTWDPQADDWDSAYALLVRFAAREKHARVPVAHRERGFALGRWVNVQRTRRQKMPKERRQRLEAVEGWAWRVRG